MTDHNLQQSIDELVRVERKILRTQQWWYSIIHGIMVGIGGTVGIAIVLTLILGLLNKLERVPGAATARDLIEHAVDR